MSPPLPSIRKPTPAIELYLSFFMFGGAKLRAEILQREPRAVAQPTRGGALRRR